MQAGNYQFSPPLWSIIVTLILLSVFIRLGVWQLERAEEKQVIAEQRQALMKQGNIRISKSLSLDEVFEYQNVEVTGKFLTDIKKNQQPSFDLKKNIKQDNNYNI